MASYVNLTLDTIAPSGHTIDAPTNTASRSVTVTLACPSSDKSQMKIWGDVDGSDTNVKSTEGASTWVTFATSATVTLSIGDGVKSLYFKVRDDVWNESTVASDTVTLAATTPTITITTALDVSRISKIATKNLAHFAFSSDVAFIEYKVKVVSATDALESAGASILTANGSSNVSATGSFPASTPITVTINGTDLENASNGDTTKTLKVFVKNAAGVWSVA